MDLAGPVCEVLCWERHGESAQPAMVYAAGSSSGEDYSDAATVVLTQQEQEMAPVSRLPRERMC
jgi:hypothetical protein